MNKQSTSYKVLGIMSGTSLDGIDLCIASYNLINQQWSYNIIAAKTLPYSNKWKQQLINCETASGEELIKLHFEYGAFLGKAAFNFINESKETIDFISSHGHTIFHQTENGFTFQLGHGAAIAANSKHQVISDFRSQDVALGGQGAPLVPVGDYELFSDYACCINLGGICNFSYQLNDKLLAYDIAPCNMVLNYLMKKYFSKEYDSNGDVAKTGKTNHTLLSHLNELEYYRKKPPKSLGKEWIFQQVIPLIELQNILPEDKLNTFTFHIASQLLKAIEKEQIKGKILLSGGGTKNLFLINQLKKCGVKGFIPDEELIDFKEALIFGYLGIKRLRKEINVHKSVTASSKNTSSGSIFLP